MRIPPLESRRFLAVAALAASLAASRAPAQETYGLPLDGEAAEAFLKTAQVVRKKGLSIGITHSDQYTLSDGSQTHKAVWKTIDEFKRGVTNLQSGGVYLDFADSWKHEVAAYELDKLLGTRLVPPTVERTFEGKRGSLQLWVEGVMTESERKKKNPHPPDIEAWNRQMYTVRLLHQLVSNADSRNIQNVLVDPSFRIYAVDFSRAFQIQAELPSEKELLRFSRRTLEALKALDRPTLDAKLGKWLTGAQIDPLLKRRDKMLELAARRVQERGEAAALFP